MNDGPIFGGIDLGQKTDRTVAVVVVAREKLETEDGCLWPGCLRWLDEDQTGQMVTRNLHSNGCPLEVKE
jgi:hypothetical protein